jgi:hypothetical protein
MGDDLHPILGGCIRDLHLRWLMLILFFHIITDIVIDVVY